MSDQPGVAPLRPRRSPHRPAAPQVRRLVLEPGAGGVVARCREFARTALADWEWLTPGPKESRADRQAAVDDVLLVVSELVTNACLHAGGPRELRLVGGGDDEIRVEVADGTEERPEASRPHRSGRPGGHGIFIVQRLSAAWGVAPDRDGKTVWAVVRRR
ncbi:hypothetical protein BIV57_04925 [Mangrovactinospora gilvigrisea]|uniref:Histidine kinase/HSP90-like ATPase domain-containing protein n=1 Tax=Mangrovactinospora gilvigrisea TaxID=1428644 RepID=A0A1J7BIY2_9ACTN|nr:ATP-binding protein [Mangrovactinospora gilvigrisea]OIV38598.1 hypothetical protein BIV57_04925 [Mangrovactinospora gilvigrisea]